MNQQIVLTGRWPGAAQFFAAFRTARATRSVANPAAAAEPETPLVDHEALHRVLAKWQAERESEVRAR
jgi:hypothetical protein